MLIIQLDKKSQKTLYLQIVDKIAGMIETGSLKTGDVLPSTRKLAQTLDVSRQTVVQAYEELWALGYLNSHQGAYTTVKKRASIVNKKTRGEIALDYDQTIIGMEKSQRINGIIHPEVEKKDSKNIIDMSTMNLDSSIFPVAAFRKSLNKLLLNVSPSLLNYGHPMGYYPLREWISKRMLTHSIDVYPDEVLLTEGISQALELLINLFTEKGDTVFLETPGYRVALSQMRVHGLRIVGIPMSSDGMNLDILEEQLQRHCSNSSQPKFIYTVPTFHNPTGITTSQSHRERLLSLCLKYSVPLIEDSFEEEIDYFNRKVLPIKSMDNNQIVFYLGTFSKVLFPGLRTGWIAGEKAVISKLTALKKVSHLSSNTLTQGALYEFCHAGYFERFIKKVNQHYSQKMENAQTLLEKNLSFKGVSWNCPSGGYLFWIKVDLPPEREEQLLNICEAEGVKVFGGREFFTKKPDGLYLRVSVSAVKRDDIKQGIEALSRAIQDSLNTKSF
ncbi:MAG: PLP-dependent aminotransferase family protein [Thermotogota bacterium]